MATTDAAPAVYSENKGLLAEDIARSDDRARADVSLAGHGLDQGMAAPQKQPVTALTLPAHDSTRPMRRREQSFRTQGLRSGTDPPESAIP